jgi:hypothetical protein
MRQCAPFSNFRSAFFSRCMSSSEDTSYFSRARQLDPRPNMLNSQCVARAVRRGTSMRRRSSTMLLSSLPLSRSCLPLVALAPRHGHLSTMIHGQPAALCSGARSAVGCILLCCSCSCALCATL